jgi:hypothetical protein
MTERTKTGGVLAATFKDRVDKAELTELTKLLGHIRNRGMACVSQLDLGDVERRRFYQGINHTSEALRVVLEEVKRNVR